jgi:hypothetical protein
MKLQLTNSGVIATFQALQKLEGCQLEPNGKTRYAIARNLRALSEPGEAIEAFRAGLKGNPDAEVQWQTFLREPWPQPVELFPLSYPALKVDENQFSPTLLANLLPILENCPD